MMMKEVYLAGLEEDCSGVELSSSSNEEEATDENEVEDKIIIDVDGDDDGGVSCLDTLIKCEEGADPCVFCGQAPCDWESFGDMICEECDELKEGNIENNQIRFHAYKLYTRLRHGVLRRFDRRPLPMCVRSEITDSWPDPNHNYIGFQSAINQAAEE